MLSLGPKCLETAGSDPRACPDVQITNEMAPACNERTVRLVRRRSTRLIRSYLVRLANLPGKMTRLKPQIIFISEAVLKSKLYHFDESCLEKASFFKNGRSRLSIRASHEALIWTWCTLIKVGFGTERGRGPDNRVSY